MDIFGLDIGSTSIKIAQMQKEGKGFRLLSAGLAPTPVPGIASEAEKDLVALVNALKKLHRDAKITTNKVVVSLPESGVFSQVIEVPPMKEKELAQAITWEAERIIPKPLSEVILDWQVISQGAAGPEVKQMRVFLVAAPKLLVEKYQKVLNLAGFEVVAIETEIIAAARALVAPTSPPVVVVDFGAASTDMAIVEGGQVALTRSIPTAGAAFTRAISSTFSFEASQAEEYKRAYGLTEKPLEGKVKMALDPVFGVVTKEMKKVLDFWKEKRKVPISNIVLTGGTASLPQVSTILAKFLGAEVQLANPFVRLTASEQLVSRLKGNAPLFAVVVGLAQKEV